MNINFSLIFIDLDIVASWKFPGESISQLIGKKLQYTGHSLGASVEVNPEKVELGFSYSLSSLYFACIYIIIISVIFFHNLEPYVEDILSLFLSSSTI